MDADELERIIADLDQQYHEDGAAICYHPDTGSVVSDSEYDQMRLDLRSLRPDSYVFQTPTASADNGNNVAIVTHEPPMTSIEKINATGVDAQAKKEQMLKDWLEECCEELGYDPQFIKDEGESSCFTQEYKLDGIALSIRYRDGKLIEAGLRSRDGINGEDVTENVRRVANVPETLPLKIDVDIRGEVICHKETFEKNNAALKKAGEPGFKNARAYTSGTLRQGDPQVVEDRELAFYAYRVIWHDHKVQPKEFSDAIECAKWCNKTLKIRHVQVRPFRWSDLEKMEAGVGELPYEVDGVVLSIRVIDDQEQMGRYGSSPNANPKGKQAWKFREKEYGTTARRLDWNTNRTGAIVPVVNFDPVIIDGTTVSRASGHNLGNLWERGIKEGTEIGVIKSGKIIPFIVSVGKGQGKVTPPNKCPSCHGPTHVNDSNILYCGNRACPAQLISTLRHYLTIFGVKGVGESTIQKLVEAKLVKSPGDFYKLGLKDLLTAGLTDRQALLCMARIHMIPAPEKIKDNDVLSAQINTRKGIKKVIPLWQFFASFGIDGAGKTAGRKLVSYFKGDFDAIRSAGVEDLKNVSGIGEVLAESISTFFADNGDVVDDVLKHVEPELPQQGKLSGKIFVFTGGFDGGKAAWEKKVQDQGAETSGSVSKNVHYVVIGDKAGSKAAKAQKLKIPTLTPDQLEKML